MFISPNTYENLKKNDSKINAADIVKTKMLSFYVLIMNHLLGKKILTKEYHSAMFVIVVNRIWHILCLRN